MQAHENHSNLNHIMGDSYLFSEQLIISSLSEDLWSLVHEQFGSTKACFRLQWRRWNTI